MSGPEACRWELEALGLASRSVFTLHHEDGVLYAGTDDGLFRVPVGQARPGSWTAAGLGGSSIGALVRLEDGAALAAVRPFTDDTVPLYRSPDGGDTWSPVMDAPVRILGLTVAAEGRVLAATLRGIAKSDDGGRSWELSPANRFRTIAANPRARNVVWAGGDGDIFVPVLVRSVDGGDTWVRVPTGVPFDNIHGSLAFDPSDSQVVFTGLIHTVVRTTDFGETWEAVIEEAPYGFVGLVVAERSGKVIAGGVSGEPGIVIFVSDDRGDSFEPITLREGASTGAGEGLAGILDLLVVQEGSREFLYLGTQDEGVFRTCMPE